VRERALSSSRRFPKPPAWVKELVTVEVTGTNGKTSTTHFLASALGALARPVGVITTIGMFLDETRVNAPRSYAGMLDVLSQAKAAGGRFAALEVTSEVLARGFAQAFPFRAAAFTNLTRDHFDAHGSAEHYFASKAQLFRALPAGGVAVVNGADEVADLLREVTPAHARFLSYGVASRGEAQLPLTAKAEVTRLDFEGTALSVELSEELGGGRVELRTRAIGEVFAENALCAWLTAVALGVPPDAARDAIAARGAPSGRFEVVATAPWVVVDYAHTPDALARTLDTARRLSSGRVSVVFGAGGNRDRGKRPQLGAAAAAADRIVITNDNPRSEDPRAIVDAIRSGLPATADVVIELDRVNAVELAVLGAAENDVIVLAGKGHESTQTAAGQAHEQSDQALGRAAHAKRALRGESGLSDD
jgi:UDP-N-acetylmuramoyl-L-alanyl-D-glutamate--2,6-diaminopimelate ligase